MLIKNKPIAQKDKSFLKTSTGNEAATKAFGQGLITKKTKGKAYFTSWSMNVMVEGYNVARHTDLTTHNHGSQPGNTMMWPFVAGSDGDNGDCRGTIDKANKACGSDKERNKDTFKYRTAKKRAETWKDRNCKGLKTKASITSLEADAKKLKERVDLITNKLDALKKKMAKVPPKTGKNKHQDVFNRLNRLKTGFNKDLQIIEQATKEYQAGDTNSDHYTDRLTKKAKKNTCLEARKCLFVPYKDSETKSRVDPLDDSKGCCPGQTGHHIFPDAWGKALKKKALNTDEGCKKYTSGGAPVVCVEGTGRYNGSHGKIHKKMDDWVELLRDLKGRSGNKSTVSVQGAITMAEGSFHHSIGGHCDRKCTIAQLKHYYKDKAKCSGEVEPTKGNEGGDKADTTSDNNSK